MWWRNLRQWRTLAWPARLAVVLAAAGLTAGCWQPLYGARPGPGGEGVQDKFAAVDIPPIAAPKGTPTERVAIGMRNALQFDLHNGGSPIAADLCAQGQGRHFAIYRLHRSHHRPPGHPDSNRHRVATN